MKFDEHVYVPVKTAIIQSPKGSNGKTFSELTEDFAKIIRKNYRILSDLSHGIRSLSAPTWRQEEW